MSLPKPYYEDTRAGITIYNANMHDILPSFPDGSFDILWTDPPYGHNNNNGDLIHHIELAVPSRAKRGQIGVLVELDERWCALAVKRLRQEFLDLGAA